MRRLAAAASLAVLLALAVAISASGAIHAELLSVNSNGVPANDYSSTTLAGTISRDGRFMAFDSRATNLPGGSGTYFLTYLRDTERNRTMLMARGNNGEPANGAAVVGGISANGNVVSFEGAGTGLPGADPDNTEVWIRDRPAGKDEAGFEGEQRRPRRRWRQRRADGVGEWAIRGVLLRRGQPPPGWPSGNPRGLQA